MKDFIDLVAIEVIAEGLAKHTFIGVFDGPRGQQRLTLPPEALLDYGAYQRSVLVGAGLLARHYMAEGMASESANRIWHSYTDTLLNAYWRQVSNAAPATMN